MQPINNKMKAAMAAVLYHIQSEQEAVAMLQAQQAQQAQPMVMQQPPPPANWWGQNGRQTQMQIRNLMQLRTFRG